MSEHTGTTLTPALTSAHTCAYSTFIAIIAGRGKGTKALNKREDIKILIDLMQLVLLSFFLLAVDG